VEDEPLVKEDCIPRGFPEEQENRSPLTQDSSLSDKQNTGPLEESIPVEGFGLQDLFREVEDEPLVKEDYIPRGFPEEQENRSPLMQDSSLSDKQNQSPLEESIPVEGFGLEDLFREVEDEPLVIQDHISGESRQVLDEINQDEWVPFLKAIDPVLQDKITIINSRLYNSGKSISSSDFTEIKDMILDEIKKFPLNKYSKEMAAIEDNKNFKEEIEKHLENKDLYGSVAIAAKITSSLMVLIYEPERFPS